MNWFIMSKESLENEKKALEEWLEKVKENNSNEYEDYYLTEYINEQINKINKELEKYI